MTAPSGVNVLVTGGSGFLGQNLVRAISKKQPSWTVTILDLNAPPSDLAAAFLQADVTSVESVQTAFAGLKPDIVVHCAGFVPTRHNRYSSSKKLWEKVRKVNYDGTVNILNATLASGCTRLLYTSSCTVIIDNLDQDFYNYTEESVLPGRATLHYGRSKGMAEQFVLSPTHAEKGLRACALRPCTIMGPGDSAVISVIHDLIAKNETGFIIGSGDNLYDWMYISNAVQAHLLAMSNLLTTSTAAGLAINISNQEPVYLWDFFLFIWAQFGHVPKWRVCIPVWLAGLVALGLEFVTWVTGAASTLDSGSVKEGFRTHYASNERAQRVLGYWPEVSLAEGVRRSCEDYKKQLAARKTKTK